MRYYSFGEFLGRYFPYKVQKIAVDVGFSCPNRDGVKGWGGCTYCDGGSFSPGSKSVGEGIAFFARKYANMKYLVYFQSGTGTYGGIDVLRARYEGALGAHSDVVGLVIGTRPDCLGEEVIEYLAELRERVFVLVEIGIESTKNETLRRINRRHTWEEGAAAVCRVASRGILVGAHVILGLPGEGYEDYMSHAERLAELPLATLKLHQLQVIKGTRMAAEYEAGARDFGRFEVEEYVDVVIDFMERTPTGVAFDRFVAQSPEDRLLLSGWGLKNYEFRAKLERRLEERGTRQGVLVA
ncbi:MAG: TIGR01212 family radical SAM protein [Tannerellaceae bacterium]|jgi:radical SAM protein (TIGR01212 family)|nr:TIGR01212 family radical SAM protein [Tannerellaceae bacterium]